VAKEKQDEFLKEIDEELKTVHVKVRKIVSEADSLLKEYQGEEDGQQGDGQPETEDEPTG
jgi:hypothetical protein